MHVLNILLFNLPRLANTLKSFLLLLTKWTMTVISIHQILTGPAIKTRVTLTVIDDGITRFAWVHRTTQIKMDGVADNTEKPRGELSSLSRTGQVMQAFHHITNEKCTAKKRENLGSNTSFRVVASLEIKCLSEQP